MKRVRAAFESLPIVVFLALMGALLIAPLGLLAVQAFQAEDGGLTLAPMARYLAEPGLSRALAHSALLGGGVTVLVLPLAFVVAFALERSRLPCKALLQAAASIPLLIPSLLPALALVYLFGRQGLLTPLFGGRTIYGFPGVLAADAVACFPHALVILRTALSAADGRLYEQAQLLGSPAWRTFWRITLPSARHGLASAAVVVFSLTIADVGAPKVVGGDFDVLALDIYKAVLGRQDFQTGAIAALFLLAPSIAAVVVERVAARRQSALISSRSTRYVPPRDPARDACLGIISALVGAGVVGLLAVCQWAALVRQWPYDLSLSLEQYQLDRFDGGGWSAVWGSLLLGLASAGLGALLAFLGAYAAERTAAPRALRSLAAAAALAPAATPGLALGLAYVLFFNDPANPLHALYGTFAILLAATVAHYYTVPHLTCVAALKALDGEFEAAGRALGRSRLTLIRRVIVPLAAPALVEVAVYLFVAATTTVSAVVFLYPPDVKLAAVAVLNMDDAGDTAPAAAMSMLIVYVNLAARLAGLAARAQLTRRASDDATAQAAVLDDGRRVRVTWPDGESRAFCARWLYDHADEARDPVSGQRRHGALDLADAAVAAATVDGDRLALAFTAGLRRLPLARLRDDNDAPRRELWTTPDLIAGCPPIAFGAYLSDDAALAQALRRLARGGLVLLTDAGEDPAAVNQAAARFGFIRETNYGAVFDVRVEAEPGNLAFTERALDLHTDNPYRDPVPTLQLLHAIRADEAGGGQTAFVDGFAHAEALRREAPEAFAILAREPVRFRFTEASGARWSAAFPVLELDARGTLRVVRLNHRSLDLAPVDAARSEAWYEAYLLFYRRLHADGAAFERRLAPGELVIFDNRRVLHGRRAFQRGGARWLRGAYADVDGLQATLARLAAQAPATRISRSA